MNDHQLLPPGWQDGDPWTGPYRIYWSVYIRCSNREKLRRTHLPALDALLEHPHGTRSWYYDKQDYYEDTEHTPDPNEHRVEASESVAETYTDRLVIDLMRRLYRLAPHWQISARLDASGPRGVWLSARATPPERSTAPAITDVLVELECDFSAADPHITSSPDTNAGRPIRKRP